jgi:hypothetical protein
MSLPPSYHQLCVIPSPFFGTPGGNAMSTTVSTHQSGQSKHIPSRQERDDAFSTGAGRKAVEQPKKERNTDCKVLENNGKRKNVAQALSDAPIGLELETKIIPSIGSALETKKSNCRGGV